MNLKYTPRLTTPAANNKAYINVEYGGKNHAILGNSKGRVVKGSVLPNCTGYVHGRAIELIGNDSKLCLGNAENYWDYTQDGFERSHVPIVGSIGCAKSGRTHYSSDGVGHVFWVEDKNSHGDILISHSGWSGTKENGRYFRTNWLKCVNGTYALSGSLQLQGFIRVWNPTKIIAIKDAVYRMYNPNSGQHLFTNYIGEAQSLANGGWTYEGVGWKAPSKGTNVFRLYNPNTGDHVLTANVTEVNRLTILGWRNEGITMHTYSGSGKGRAVHRLYNPVESMHMYTIDVEEKKALVKKGWKYEGVAFYGLEK